MAAPDGRRSISVSPEYQLFEETVYKDIAYGPTMTGVDERELEGRNSSRNGAGRHGL